MSNPKNQRGPGRPKGSTAKNPRRPWMMLRVTAAERAAIEQAAAAAGLPVARYVRERALGRRRGQRRGG